MKGRAETMDREGWGRRELRTKHRHRETAAASDGRSMGVEIRTPRRRLDTDRSLNSPVAPLGRPCWFGVRHYDMLSLILGI